MGDPFHLKRQVVKQHQVAVYSSNYTLYGDMSRRVMQVLSGFTPELEIYSIDEAFLNLAGFEDRDLTLYEGLTSQALCSGHPFSLFRVSWFNLKASFFVPTRRPHTLSRAGAVKVGRRASLSPKHRCLSGHALTAASTSARWHWPGRRLRGEPAFCGAMRLVPHPCIRWVAKTHTHDAIMRIGGEAPRRRAHSTPRHESHVGARVAATSNRHRQTITLLRDAPRLSGVN